MTTSDSRREQRQEAVIFIGSKDGVTLPMGRTLDLSLAGVRVETDGRPPVGALVEVSLGWKEKVVDCSARVARHTDAGVALDFLDPPESFKKIVAAVIEARGRVRPGQVS